MKGVCAVAEKGKEERGVGEEDEERLLEGRIHTVPYAPFFTVYLGLCSCLAVCKQTYYEWIIKRSLRHR